MIWPWRQRRAPRGALRLTRAEAFEIAYGRRPTEDEARTLEQLRPTTVASNAGRLRSVIACFDRLKLATPISVRFAEAEVETVDCDGFRLAVDRFDLAVSRVIKHARQYEPHLSDFVRRVVKPGMTAIDVGANIGYYTMLLAQLVGADGRVLAFEPSPENCRLILRSAEINGFGNVKVYPFAVSAGLEAAYWSPAIGSNGALVPEAAGPVARGDCLIVPSLPLDAVPLDRADLIKLDIEGAEYLALCGAEQLVRRCRPIVTTEFSLEMMQRVSGIAGADFLRWVASLGYRIYVLGREALPTEEVADVERYLAGWGDRLRVEDLALIPAELDLDPRR